MATAEVLVGIDGPKPTPFDYILSAGEGFEPTAVFAIFDGSAAGAAFLACLTFVSQDGRILSRVFPSSNVNAGDTADVTFSPFALAPSGGAGGGGGTAIISLPINLTNPAVAGTAVGDAFPTVVSLSGGDHGGWAFVKSLTGLVFGTVRIPAAYKSGGAVVLLFGAQTGTGNVRLNVGSHRVAAGAVYDPTSYTLETAQTVTVSAVKTLTSASFTLTSAPAAGELLFVELVRFGGDGADTLADTMLLFGAWLVVTIAT